MIKQYLSDKQKSVNHFLEERMPSRHSKPPIIYEAMRYSLFAGGKRIRPILTILIHEMLGGSGDKVLYPACSIELIHTYSLIHDDLPALDNDDYRRGKLSSHKKFGEAIAILAGDALLTMAFQWIGKTEYPPQTVQSILQIVSEAAGVAGMIGGQVADLEAENRNLSQIDEKEELEYIHLNKTAALLRASILIGSQTANASSEQYEKLYQIGTLIGLAFQVADDILDVEGDEKEIGKSIGKDKESNKLTYPALYGLETSKKKANELIEKCCELIKTFENNQLLLELSQLIINRKN